MKKVLIAAAVALFALAPAAMAQVKLNVDKESFLKKIAKSDADIANPKKAAKAATWLSRGDLFYQAETAVNGIMHSSISEAEMNIMFGEPQSRETVEIGNKEMVRITYPYIVAYFDTSGAIQTWQTTYVVYDNALEKSVEAFVKAYDLDKSEKNAAAVKQGLSNAYNEYYKAGSLAYALAEYQLAGENFEKAYRVSQYPAFGDSDTAENIANLANDTGIAYLFAENYSKSLEFLRKAEAAEWYRDGDVYYLMYHAYKGLAPNNEREQITQAKEMLLAGLDKFPDNSNIIECVTDAYMILGDDPNDLVPRVETAIERDSENVSLWSGLGRLYEKLGNLDGAIGAIEHVTALVPENSNAFYSLGILLLRKGDNMADYVNNDPTITSQKQYDTAMAQVKDTYRLAIAPLEKAYQLAGNDSEITLNVLQLLKGVTHTLRDEPGMMDKFAHYSEVYDSLTVN